jgi:DNA-binding SARP family transcriptional activator/tetratricopeptide (TPR) repeat protein
MLHIALFGEQAIRNGTSSVRTRSSRTLELVGFLASHAETPQPRTRIAGLFWPDSTDEQALTNLRRELHHLRQLLRDEPALAVDARDLCWHDSASCEVDVRVFERHYAAAVATDDETEALTAAAAGIACYRGEFMPGSYDDWAIAVRAEREQQCIDLLDLVTAIRTRRGDLVRALEAARRRIQLRPLEELGYRRVIELQGDLGDRAGAVSTYHHCASVLERELGVEPDPATRAALDRLLTAAPKAPQRGEPAGHRRARPGATALIGRGAEYEALQAAWSRACAGRPTVALVHGEAGVGKTRLVADLATAARQQGAVVASAQCFGTSGRLALAPVADWLRTPGVQAAAATLDPVWRVEVERLVPTTATGTSEAIGTGRAMVDAWQRHRFFEGLARALGAVDRPLLLVLDNAQWCDQETLAFLTFCLGLRPDAPLMLAGTLRDDDHENALDDWISRLQASGVLTEVALQPLDLADTTRLAEAMVPTPLDPAAAGLLHATTGGFPLHVVEAVRGIGDPNGGSLPSGGLDAVLDARFAHLTTPAREVAGLAAAVGRDFPLDLLTEASDLQPDAVVHAVDELWRYRILRESGGGYDFSHDLLRDHAYAAVTPPRRWLLHRRIAQGLELLHGDNPDAVSAQLADQYVRAGRGERAIQYYRRAAEVATARFAHGEAIRLHRAALSVLRGLPEGRDRDRQELLLLETIAAPLNALHGYSSPELRTTLERAITLAESLNQREALVNGLVGLWTSQFVQGFTADAHRTAARALTLVEPGSELSGTAHFAFAGSALSLGRPAEAVEHFNRAAALCTTHSLTVGTRPDVHGRAFAAHAHWLLGDSDAARASAYEAIAMARANDTPYSLAVALAYGAITQQLCTDLAELDETVSELRGLCERYDFAYYREWSLVLGGWLRGGADGIATARRGIDTLIGRGALARMPYWLTLLSDLSERAGNSERARADLDAAEVGAAARDDVWWLPEVMRKRARYDVSADAIARLHRAIRLAQAQNSHALVARCAADLEERTGQRVPS